MNHQPTPDWDPKSPEVIADQRATYDAMRRQCPMAYSESRKWSLFSHEEIARVLNDHQTFSNAVSQHLSVPNGMDPPEHTEYRRMIESYFEPARMATFEPKCRRIVDEVLDQAATNREIEVMADWALPFAVRVQCEFLGWPANWHKPLVQWTRRNQAATLAEDRSALSAIAREFEGFIDELIDVRVQSSAGPDQDLMSVLIHEKVWGRRLSNEEIASILRNWTVGEIGTISASVGILIHHLGQAQTLQSQLRSKPSLLPAAIEEMLRIHGPLVTNRRVTTCPVELNGHQLSAGERVTINWMAANRDEGVFEEPESFRFDRNPDNNLLWGAGIHVCPGAPLARLEMRVFLEELLNRTTQLELQAEKRPTLAVYPASGYATLYVACDLR